MSVEDKIERAGQENLFQETTELGQVMENLDAEDSKLDFNTRLSGEQIAALLVAEELRDSGILYFIGICNKAKKLSVSKDGQGREEKVRIAAAKTEADRGMGFGERLKGLFSPRE